MKTILQDGDPILRATAKEVPKEMFGSEELRGWIAQMTEAMNGEPDGVAIAAPQIGIPYRIFLVRHDRIERKEGAPQTPHVGVYINPVLIKISKEKKEMDEGCLSVRGKYGKTMRHARATVRAFDELGKAFERGGGGVLAQAFQHEIDHLDGILFHDHATGVKEFVVREHLNHKPFVFFGTPHVASQTLLYLYQSGYTPTLIITSPPAPKGRGHALLASETQLLAEQLHIPVITPEKITDEVVEQIKKLNAEYGICVAYGKILPQKLIDIFPLGIFNIHYSLLPKYRGASPVEAALLNGERETGITIQKMVKELDAGDMVAQVPIPITENETIRELRPRLIALGRELLVEVLPYIESKRIQFVPQDHTKATRCGKYEKENGEIDMGGDAKTNWNKYRAYADNIGTYFFTEQKGNRIRIKITHAEYRDGKFLPLRVIPEGKKEMNYKDFMRG